MPVTPDYTTKAYSALKENVEGFDKTPDQFKSLIKSDPNYRSKVYSALKDNIQGFDKTPQIFDSLITASQKKNSNLSVGADGQLKQSDQSVSQSKSQPVPDFGMKSFSDLAKGQQSVTDNSTPSNVTQFEEAQEERATREQRAADKAAYQKKVKDAIPDALANTAKNSLRQKGINPDINTAQLNQEKAKYALELSTGNADVGFDKEGKPGLIQKTGFLDSFHDHMMAAINENKDAREFKDMTVPQRVEFAKKQQVKEPTPYIGSKPTELGSLGATSGGAFPTLGLYGVGALAGGALESLAPETGGLSNLALKPVMSFVVNAGSEANKSGMQGTLSRFYAIKQQHPEMSDEDAMTHAGKGEDVDRLAGISQAALFSETGGTLGKSVTKSFLKSAAKTGIDVGGKTAVVEGLKDIGHNAEGVTDKSASDIVKDMGKAFAENAPMGAALHGFMGLITGVAKLPGLLKSALKYDVVTKMKPEEVNAEIDKNVASGAITPEQADKAKTDLDQFAKVVNKVPIGLSDESKAAAAGLILKRENKKKEEENKDESAKEIYDEQINSINGQIKEIYRTDKPLEHEINPATGETFKKPTFDNIAAMKVKNLADKISKGKEITEPEEIQVEHNFPDELEKNLNRIAREEKSGNKDKENPNTELSDNIKTYLEKNESKDNATKAKDEIPVTAEKAGVTDEGTNQIEQPTEEIKTPEIKQPQNEITSSSSIQKEQENGSGQSTGGTQTEADTIPAEEVENTGEGKTVGIHHEALTKLADKLGLPKPEAGDVFTTKEYAERGKVLIDNGADPKQIADDFENDGKVNADIISVAKAHLVDLVKAADNARTQFGEKSTEYQKALKDVQDWSENVAKPMGTKFGEIGRALQGETDLDTGSFVSVSRAVEEKTGKPLTPEQSKVVADLTNKVKEQGKIIEDLNKKFTENIDRNIKETGRPQREKLSTQLSDLAKRLRTSIEFDDFLKGAGGDIKKSGVDFTRLKEIAATILEDAAKAVKAGENAIEFIRKAVENLKEDIDKEKLISSLNSIGENAGLFDIKEGNPEAENIKMLEKKLNGIKEGKTKNKTEERQKSAKEIDLENQIQLEKDRQLIVRLASKTDNNFTPEQVKDIWEYAKRNYVDKGEDVNNIIRKTSKDLGLSSKQVLTALEQPKGSKVISDKMFALQNRRAAVQTKVKDYVETVNRSKVRKWLTALPNFFFQKAIFGHGTVGMITHAGLNIFRPSTAKIYWPLFFKQFKNSFGGLTDKGLAAYEKSMEHLRNNPLFIVAKRAGVKVDPGQVNDDYAVVKKFLGNIGTMGDRGFNTLKEFRMAYFENEYNKLSDREKADPETLKEIAKLVNHSTGTSDFKSNDFLNVAVFAPKLEASKWARVLTDPAKAIATLSNWENASMAEKAAAKIVGKKSGELLATYLGALAVNQALLYAAGSKQSINFTNPTQKDWLKFKAGDENIDLSGGIIPTTQFIGHLLYLPFESKQELGQNEKRSRIDAFGKTTLDYGLSKLSPFAGTTRDVVTAHDFKGNTMPWSNDKPKNKYAHKLDWKEYLVTQQAPIPVAEAFKDIYQSMSDRGMSNVQINDILTGVFKGVISGGTGAKVSTDYSVEQKPTGAGGGASGSFHPVKRKVEHPQHSKAR